MNETTINQSCSCSGETKERKYDEYIYVGLTRSICDKCYDEFLQNKDKNAKIPMVDAEILFKDGKVYLKKYCEKHGYSFALKSSDTNWYKKVWDPVYLRRGTPPLEKLTKREEGCPYDCGVCEDHHQHICVPLIDITDACDLNCNICLSANNKNPSHITLEDFENRIDTAIRTEGSIQAIVLSGGEPSLHPELFSLIEAANKRKEISRITFNTNGLKVARDEDFLKKLKDYGVYVNLSFDGFNDEIYEKNRGIKNAAKLKLKAIDNLVKYDVKMSLVAAIRKGVNDDQPGKIVEEFIKLENLLNIVFQPLIFVGQGGYKLEDDPMDRSTMISVIKSIEKDTNGMLKEDDFSIIPCAHGECQMVSYLYVSDKKILPYNRFMKQKDFINAIKNEPGIRPEVYRDIISKKGMTQTKDLASDEAIDRETISNIEKNNKQIFLHHFMDAYNFDLGRLKRCCNMYLTKDGKQIPACWYNMYHRNINRF